jgi:opacity protein-like surface antigen
MKMIKFCLLVTSVIISTTAVAQQTSKKSAKKHGDNGDGPSRYSFYIGGGMASYLGDLVEGNRLFNQPGWAYNCGITADLTKNLAVKIDVGYQKIQAKDSKNSKAVLKNRNLGFASNVFDASLNLEYTLFDLTKRKISPFVSVGLGAVFFNPYAYENVTGKRVYLRTLGTEGQGLGGYPDFYKGVAAEFPVAGGVKYQVNEKLQLKFEFNYRFTNTDYLDDVSRNYPSKAALDLRNPVTAFYTNPSGPYPATNSQRGNPKKKDVFYTTELKLAFRL